MTKVRSRASPGLGRVRMDAVPAPALDPSFAARIQAWEEAALAPAAARS